MAYDRFNVRLLWWALVVPVAITKFFLGSDFNKCFKKYSALKNVYFLVMCTSVFREHNKHFHRKYKDDMSMMSTTSSQNGSPQPEAPLSKRTILCCRVSILNVVLMGFGFMLNLGAYATAGMAQTVVLNSVRDEYFQGTPTLGYLLWAICNGSQAFAYLLGPSVIAILGPKLAMVLGSVCVSLYIACFLRPLVATLVVGAIVVGWGVGIIWTIQGHFITINSTSKRVLRNTGIFWVVYMSSLVTGNLFYFLMLHGDTSIATRTRIMIFSTLLAISILGIIVFSAVVHPWTEKLPRPPEERAALSMGGEEPSQHRGPKEALATTIKFAWKRDMLILLPMFFYIGIEGTFWVNVYGTALGYTESFGSLRQSLVGLSGVFVGVGEITGGLMLGLLGKWMHVNGKDGALMLGLVVHIVAYYLTYINIPPTSSLRKSDESSFIGPDPYVAMAVSFLMGFGDAIWNSQLMAYLGCVYRHDCVSVFAVYQFWCAIGASAAFLYATVLTLPYQLLIAIINAVAAAAGFCVVEWEFLRTHVP